MFAAIPFPEISPEIFTIPLFGMEFALRWYALAYIAGLLLGWRIVVHAVKRPSLWPNNTSPMTPAQVEDLLTWVILGVIIGGRLGFVLFYNPVHYLQNPSEILMVWQGGMAFHGGFLGVVAAGWVFCTRQNIPKAQVGDAMALVAPVGLLLGRIANFINAELWGRATDLPWGVVFPHPLAQTCPGVEGICARHPSQLYEAALEGLLLGAVLMWLAYRRGALKIPGQIMGIFIAGYGTGRFIVEFFRQADPQFITAANPYGFVLHVQGYGVTMGQLLSLPMVAVGLVILIYARRRAPHLAS